MLRTAAHCYADVGAKATSKATETHNTCCIAVRAATAAEQSMRQQQQRRAECGHVVYDTRGNEPGGYDDKVVGAVLRNHLLAAVGVLGRGREVQEQGATSWVRCGWVRTTTKRKTLMPIVEAALQVKQGAGAVGRMRVRRRVGSQLTAGCDPRACATLPCTPARSHIHNSPYGLYGIVRLTIMRRRVRPASTTSYWLQSCRSPLRR